jgi:hypothetical protein
MYAENLTIVLLFSVFALLSLMFIPLFSGYVNAGGGFLRLSSVFYDITTPEFFFIVVVGVLSVVFISLFFAAMISIVKLKETLDHVGYFQVVREFSKYVFRLTGFFFIMYVVQFLLAYVWYVLTIPMELYHLLIIILWLPFLFYPQVVVIDSYGFLDSFRESARFFLENPLKTLFIFFVLVTLIFCLLVVEVVLGQYFVYEHKIIGTLLLSFFVLPFYVILTTEVYMKKYPISG